MKNCKTKLTNEKTSAGSAEVEKEIISRIDLLQEIEPLLNEYFIGGFEIKDNAIIMNFKNGQRFRLIAI